MSASPEKHLAAVVLQKGESLTLVERETPTPGPKELLVEVRAIAINPIDYYQRDVGLFLQKYPAVLASDLAGVVVKTGSEVRSDTPKPGARVVSYSSGFRNEGNPNYGALQQYALVSEDIVALLPDSYSFVEGSVFPMAVNVTWNGFLWAGIPQDLPLPPQNEGLLVWGASTSMGSMAVQAAKLSGYTVFATAGAQHHDYVKSLGATKVFDYKSDNLQSQIVSAVKDAGLRIRISHFAAGSQQLALDVMQELAVSEKARMAIAPVVEQDLKIPANVEISFVSHPKDLRERNERFRWIYGNWLQDKLASKQLVASPHIRVVKGGLEKANQAMDELKAGVSCTKIVLEL